MYFCLSCISGKEEQVKELLDLFFQRNPETYSQAWFPKKEVSEKKMGKITKKMKPMFPGYIFIYSEVEEEINYPFRDISKLPNVIKFLSYSDRTHSLIGNDLFFASWIHKNNGAILQSKALFTEGQRIHIAEGPLVGFDGNIIKLDKHRKRITVRFNFEDKPIDIEFTVEFLEKNSTINELQSNQ